MSLVRFRLFGINNKIKHFLLLMSNNQKKIIYFIKETLYKINPSHEYNGLIILFFHWVIVGSSLLYLFLGEINYLYMICVFLWIFIFMLHFYFRGCIFTKLERECWNTKEWKGPWLFLFHFLKPSKQMENNIFICWGILLSLFVLMRILFSKN